MTKIRIIPYEMEAVKFTGKNWAELTEFCGNRELSTGQIVPVFSPAGTFTLYRATKNARAELYLKGTSHIQLVELDDWVIKLANDNGFHAMSEENFRDNYDVIEE